MSSHTVTITRVHTALKESFHAVDPFFELAPELRSFRQNQEAWSIDQILEHLALTNHYLLMIIRRGVNRALVKAEREPLPTAGESDLEALGEIGIRGSFEWRAPAHMIPTGGRDGAEIRRILRGQGDECLALLEKMKRGEGALKRIGLSVQNLGKLDLYQWLYFLARHLDRHLPQMEEVRAAFYRLKEGRRAGEGEPSR